MLYSRYRIAFPAGFGPLAERLVRRDFGESSVLDGDDSSLTLRAAEGFSPPPYSQGSALVIDTAACGELEEAFAVFARRIRDGACVKELARAFRDKALRKSLAANRFAVRGFLRNAPTFPGAGARAAMENAVGRAVGARPDSERPDVELAIHLRDDGKAYFTVAFKSSRDAAAPGELPRSTARLLCELSEPKPDDVFLDPFMGSGSIPLERARMGPYKLIFASDRDEALVAKVKERLKAKEFERHRRTFFPKRLDATDLGRFEDGLFSAIVTDPPWGAWESLNETDLVALYASFLNQASRVLSPRAGWCCWSAGTTHWIGRSARAARVGKPKRNTRCSFREKSAGPAP
jgi:predicted RNA methylase